MTRRPSIVASLLTCAVLAVAAGCAPADEDPAPPEATGTASAPGVDPASPLASPSGPYPTVPEGIELTEPGTELGLGEDALVAWQPTQNLVGIIHVRVTRLQKTTFAESFRGWKLEGAARRTTPYFVHTQITNMGDTDLGGQRIPLYAVDGTNALVEYSSFGGTFRPCDSTDFPARFTRGKTINRCLVYLVPEPGELTAVSFRPTQEFDPITWTGPVRQPGPRKAAGRR